MGYHPRIYVADRPLRHEDVQALVEFLNSPGLTSESQLQELFRRHPPLMSILGFAEFCTEYQLSKATAIDTSVSLPLGEDRVDILASRRLPILLPSGYQYRSTHIVELKKADARLAERSHGSRLSSIAAGAVEQLKEYRHWLTTVPENRLRVSQLGWDVRNPMLYLVMGREREFVDNPGQLDEIRASLLDKGIQLFTLDDIMRRAEVARLAVVPTLIEYISLDGQKGARMTASHSMLQVSAETAIYLFTREWWSSIRGPNDIRGIGLHHLTPQEKASATRTMVLLLRSYQPVREELYAVAWEYAENIIASDGSYYAPDEYDVIGLIASECPDALEFLKRSISDGRVSHRSRAIETLCFVSGLEAEDMLRAAATQLLYKYEHYHEELYLQRDLGAIMKYKGADFLSGIVDTRIPNLKPSGTSSVEDLRRIFLSD